MCGGGQQGREKLAAQEGKEHACETEDEDDASRFSWCFAGLGELRTALRTALLRGCTDRLCLAQFLPTHAVVLRPWYYCCCRHHRHQLVAGR